MIEDDQHSYLKGGATMANIVIFHSVLGIREGVTHLADFLRAHGHTVFTPDLYDGVSFEDMDSAFEYFQMIGIPELAERSIRYCEDYPSDACYVGFSNGGASALLLAGTKPGAKGCILLHAALPLKAFGLEKWPSQIPVDVHYAKIDPWKEDEYTQQLKEDVLAAGAEFHYYEYPVEGHLFTDRLLPEYNEAQTKVLYERVLAYIGKIS
jgi:dienelactone hydrolase